MRQQILDACFFVHNDAGTLHKSVLFHKYKPVFHIKHLHKFRFFAVESFLFLQQKYLGFSVWLKSTLFLTFLRSRQLQRAAEAADAVTGVRAVVEREDLAVPVTHDRSGWRFLFVSNLIRSVSGTFFASR